MRAVSLSLALASLALAACDGNGTNPPPPQEQRVDAPAVPQPALPSAPQPSAETPPAPASTLAPAPPAPPRQPTEVAIVGGTGQTTQQIGSSRFMPLTRILDIALRRVPGEVIEVELDDDDDVPEYELEILTADGRSIEIKIDARTGAILEVEED